jgi:hypothetical protein
VTPATTPVPWMGFDLNHPSRLAAAVRLIGELLRDGGWHPWRQVVDDTAARFPDLKHKTINTLIRNMVRTGTVERKGKYNPRFRSDHRMVRLPQFTGAPETSMPTSRDRGAKQ